MAARKEPVLASLQLVAHECRDEIEGGQLFRLGIAEPRVEDVGHAGEAEFAQREGELNEIHVGSPVLASMTARYSVSCRMIGSTWRSVRGTGGRRSRYLRRKRYVGTPISSAAVAASSTTATPCFLASARTPRMRRMPGIPSCCWICAQTVPM